MLPLVVAAVLAAQAPKSPAKPAPAPAVATPVPPAKPAPPAAPPAPPPPPRPALDLLRAVDDAERRVAGEGGDVTRASLAKLRKALKADTTDKPLPPAELAKHADALLELLPDDEVVHLTAITALLQIARALDDSALRDRTRFRARSFVERHPEAVRAHDLHATLLGALGDEEGQLRALAACGEGCRPRLLDTAKAWQRLRCTDEGIARGLVLRIGKDILAVAEDVAFLEPIAGAPAVAPTYRDPAGKPEVLATCTMQLGPSGAARFAARTREAAREPLTLIVLNGVMLVVDSPITAPIVDGAFPGMPAEVCAKLCRKPLPRPLPAGVSLAPPPPVKGGPAG